ncbi:MAG: hypothetical protein RIR69_1239 [Actinomycetota bacterium]|jgi:protein-tyrosine-phosphatase
MDDISVDHPGPFGILFLCVHNAGRSQMAAGFARHIGGARVTVFSGGSEPSDELNSVAVQVMNEIGIDISSHTPQRFTEDMVRAVDVVVTMGCGDTCPYIAGKTYIDWPLDDPRGRSVEKVREIRNEIQHLVESLIRERLSSS